MQRYLAKALVAVVLVSVFTTGSDAQKQKIETLEEILDEATKTSMQIKDDSEKSAIFRELAELYWKAGNKTSSRKLFDQSVEALKACDYGPLQTLYLRDHLSEPADYGDLIYALKLANEFEPGYSRDCINKKIAFNLVKQDRYEEAIEITKRISNSEKRNGFLCDLVRYQTEENMLEDALETLELISDKKYFSQAYYEIANDFVNNKEFALAEKFLSKITLHEYKDSILKKLISELIHIGNRNEALITYQALKKEIRTQFKYEPEILFGDRHGLLTIHARFYGIDRVVRDAIEKLDQQQKCSTIRYLIHVFLESGKTDAALELASLNFIDEWQSRRLISKIAVNVSKRKNVPAGIKIVESIPDSNERDVALWEIATTAGENGQFEDALRCAKLIFSREREEDCRHRIAILAAEQNNIEVAQSLLDRFGYQIWRVEVLQQIGLAYSRKGKKDEAKDSLNMALRLLSNFKMSNIPQNYMSPTQDDIYFLFFDISKSLLEIGDKEISKRSLESTLKKIQQIANANPGMKIDFIFYARAIARLQTEYFGNAFALKRVMQWNKPIFRAQALLGVARGITKTEKMSSY